MGRATVEVYNQRKMPHRGEEKVITQNELLLSTYDAFAYELGVHDRYSGGVLLRT